LLHRSNNGISLSVLRGGERKLQKHLSAFSH
jgi:hypothetical protein